MKRSALILAATFAALWTAPALSQPGGACAPRSKLVQTLLDDYRETQAGTGLTQTGAVLELFTSDKGTWTLLASQPNGISCMIGAGNGWESIAQIKGNPA